MAYDRSRIEVKGTEAAVDGRIVVLDSGGNADESRLEVAHESDQLCSIQGSSGELRQGADEGDGESRRATETGAAGSVGACCDLDPCDAEVLYQSIEEGDLGIRGEFGERLEPLTVILVDEVD